MQLSATTGSQPRFILYSQVCEACFDAVFRSYRLLLKEQKKKKTRAILRELESSNALSFLHVLVRLFFSSSPDQLRYVSVIELSFNKRKCTDPAVSSFH